MSFAGATPDLSEQQTGADYSDVGSQQEWPSLPFGTALGDDLSDEFMNGTKRLIGLAQDYGDELERQDLTSDGQPALATIDPQQWQKQYHDLGLTFTPDMSQGEAQNAVDQRQDELQRQYTLANAPSTATFGAARIGAEFAESAIDPTSIAAMFVPGLGETRLGFWASRFGEGVADLAKGASAGATGMAAMQPLD